MSFSSKSTANCNTSGGLSIRTATSSISWCSPGAINVRPNDSFKNYYEARGKEPFRIITDKLKSYGAAKRTIMPNVTHDTRCYANNRAEVSHQPTRHRERQMRRFKSPRQAQRFLSAHGLINNLFRVGRHRLISFNHRLLRSRSFSVWRALTAA